MQRSRGIQSIYAFHEVVVPGLDQFSEIILGELIKAIRSTFNQVVQDHLRILGILPAHTFVSLGHFMGKIQGNTA